MSIPASDARAPGEPSVSVVICAYTMDRRDALRDAVASVSRQTHRPAQIILVVDHAPKLTEAARLAWPELRVVANRETQGVSGARNTAIHEATGEIVAFLDDDTTARPDWLERLVAAYDDERVLGVGGSVWPRWLEGRPPWFPPEFDWVVGCSHAGMPAAREPVRDLLGANMSFRREALVDAGGFLHQLGRVGTIPGGCEEAELCIRLAAISPGGLIVYEPAAAVDHLVPAGRTRLRYFLSRCVAEGRSKAVLTALVGTDAGLCAERAYVRRTLPGGVLRGLGDVARGRSWGAARAVMVAIGLLTTARAYAGGRRTAVPRLAPAADGPAHRPLRVLMVTPRSPLMQGGVERHVMEVSQRLVAAGVEVKVLCGEPGGPPVEDRTHDGVRIRAVRAWPAHRDYYLAPRIWREMARERWDIVHIQSYHTLITPLAMARAVTLGIPYVVTFHGGGHSSALRHSLRGTQRRAMRRLLARASRLVAVARFEIDEYGRELRLGPEHFVLIPNGSDITAKRDGPAGESANGAVLGSIGRLERYKGHHRVISALPHVLEQRPDARLLIVGTGPYEPALRRLARELGVASRVEFTHVAPADRAGMARMLEGIDLVVLLSDFETQPLVALEAAAAGRRLLVADRAGLGELAQAGVGQAVALDDPPNAVARAIVEGLERPHAARVPQLSSWDECTAALLELYRAVR